jgi:hypothetical protein
LYNINGVVLGLKLLFYIISLNYEHPKKIDAIQDSDRTIFFGRKQRIISHTKRKKMLLIFSFPHVRHWFSLHGFNKKNKTLIF